MQGLQQSLLKRDSSSLQYLSNPDEQEYEYQLLNNNPNEDDLHASISVKKSIQKSLVIHNHDECSCNHRVLIADDNDFNILLLT